MVVTLLMAFGLATVVNTVAHAQEKKPNIVVIMGDDIGIWNIGAYHRGMMAGRTPNLDKLAAEGMLFTLVEPATKEEGLVVTIPTGP
jgi:arylsulfatase